MSIKIRFLLAGFLLFLFSACTVGNNEPKNIIFFIGDGMGPVQIETAGIYENGVPGSLSFEQFPVHSKMTTYSANNPITDSAASATAMATGIKVNNGIISRRIPGNGSDLPTILELYGDRDYYTGLVTTAFITHATPAAFGAHTLDRYNYSEVADDYLSGSRPNLLLGGGGNGITPSDAEAHGYIVIQDQAEMESLSTAGLSYVSGQFGTDYIPYEYDGTGSLPGLSEMTEFALDFMEQSGTFFFLMIEGGRIDHACHNNDITRAIYETVEFSHAVAIARAWAADRDDTLIIVTADHETGGLSLLHEYGQGVIPDVAWSTTGHTSTRVDVYAWGKDAEKIGSINDNSGFLSRIMFD